VSRRATRKQGSARPTASSRSPARSPTSTVPPPSRPNTWAGRSGVGASTGRDWA